MLAPRSLEGDPDDERPLLQELLRCRGCCPPRDPALFLAEWRPGDGDWLRRWAWPRPERWWRRLDEWTPLDLEDQRRRLEPMEPLSLGGAWLLLSGLPGGCFQPLVIFSC